ncbi:glycoside hydrolase family 9 protein [Silvibacterium dinghuense]|uniref:Glycoside hydrolase n=1 Tax=Silvibacterium dinghuense TaxID=1560006 RepID=A0A4Q1SI33_9BACT|nr:glycoside hydrolase family 9 protein [Silvibacterium dinghuense]RXS97023.1 glycoside hydrolase [Silvibacterium dinghuense]GGG95579.1 endochitinase [Silvibacterium dinghuense]
MRWALALCCAGALAQSARAEVRILVDQVGYEPGAAKIALVKGTAEDHPARFVLKEVSTGRTVFSGSVAAAGKIDQWGGTYWTADFSAFHEKGEYELETDGAHSCGFAIEDDLLEKETLSNVLYYFKGQRSSGLNDAADRHLKNPNGPGTIDVHGGWYDATGDYGIHLSHQNPTSYFNPQQVPLVAWSALASYRALEARGEDNFTEIDRRLLDEGLFGADFLVRIKRPGGSFYESITAPGAKKLAEDRVIGNPNWKTQIKKNTADSTEHIGAAEGPHAYEASFRAGGGMAIAALALASTMPTDGDFPRATYLQTAEEAFDFLAAHNRELLNDGVENILDDYCALIAATELYRASHETKYKTAADARAASLMARLVSNGRYRDYWRADGGTRPFFHPADAGLPVVSLIAYAQIADAATQAKVRETVKRSLAFELGVTEEENNPFGYARQLVRMGDGTVRTAFFFPHDTEAAPWWQGEDARLASLAAAARLAAPLFADDTAFQASLEDYAWNQLHWILGRNPYDVSLLEGSGHGDQAYMFFRSWKYRNAPGGIVNGITAAEDNEDGIAFNQGFAVTGKDEDWRWTEQWLPHAAWYLYAVSLPHTPQH